MMEFWYNFHFLRPWILLLLLLPLALYGAYFKGIKAQSSWQQVIDKRLLDYLLVKGSALKRRAYVWTGLIGLITAIIASAGPTWQKVEVPALSKQNPAFILLNLSSDMAEKDLTPSRLDRAKYKIKDFLGLLKDVQIGLEVYSSEPFVITPLTDDANILINLLPAISLDIMPTNGDRLDRALALAAEKIKSAGYTNGKLVVFAPDAGQGLDAALSTAKELKAQGFSIDIIGVSANANEKLAMIAKAGGGDYWNIRADDDKIAALAQELNQANGELNQSDNLRTVWLDAGWYLLILPLICVLSFFRRGILVLFFVCLTNTAQAGFFTNANQDGLKAFSAGDFSTAATTFQNSDWKGASFYRSKDYAKAFAEYQKNNTPEGLYNQGNALAKGGKIDEAIAKYEEVLKQVPSHEDAKFNLEYLKKQKQQQQNQQQQQSNNDNQQDNQDQQQQQNQEETANQNADDKKNNDKKQQGSENSQQQQNQQNSSPQDQGMQDKNSDKQDNRAEQERSSTLDELDENEQKNEGKQSSGALPKQADEDKPFDEKMQAKAQQYREIPEDPGGLLKAFIYQEYQQNRYNEK